MWINERLMAKWKVNGHSTVVWYWSGDPMVPRSNPLLVKKFLLLSLLIWKGGFEILPNNTWDLLKKAYGTSKKLRFQFRGQLNKPFSEPTYLYTNLTCAWGKVLAQTNRFITKLLAKSCRILQNIAESRKILQNNAESCKILQNYFK